MTILILVLLFIINILLEFNLSYIYHDLSLFSPLFFIVLIPFINKIINDKRIYFAIIIITSLIYDLLYSEKLFLIFISYLVVAIFNFIFYYKKSFNLKNLLITNILSIIIYDSIIFFALKILHNYNFVINDLLYKISHSIILNVLITICLYFICRKKENKKYIRK